MLERLDRKTVGLELDVFWVSVAGRDPVVELLKQNPGRVPLVHLKDKAKDAPVVYEESKVTAQTFKEVGARLAGFCGDSQGSGSGWSEALLRRAGPDAR